MGAASAAENPTDTDNVVMNTIDDTPLGVSENTGGAEHTLGATNELKNFTDLNREINNPGENNTVRLEGNYIYDNARDALYVNGILISRDNLIIDGQNKTVIDGSGLARIFYVPDGITHFTLKNVVVRNANSPINHGSVVKTMSPMDELSISGTFINNTAPSGGVIDASIRGTLNIDGIFTDNIAKEGFAGVIKIINQPNSQINIKGKYTGNKAATNGGVIYIENALSEDSIVNINGEFTKNTAGMYGGVIYTNGVDGDININGNFSENTAVEYGGVIYAGAVNGNVILNGTYTSNTATTGGAIINMGNVNGNVELNGTYTNNNAKEGGVARTYDNIAGSVTFKGDFTSNTASNAAILKATTISGTVDLTQAHVENNIAKWANNAMIVIDSDDFDHILNSTNTFIDNNAQPVRRTGASISWTNVPSSWYTGKALNITVTVSGITDFTGSYIKVYDTCDGITQVADYPVGESGEVILDDFVFDTEGNHNFRAELCTDIYISVSVSKNIVVSDAPTDLRSWTDLYNEIENAADPNHITLSGATYLYDPDTDAGVHLDFYDDVVIDGNGSVIDGAGYNIRLVDFYGDFSLKDITVQNVGDIVAIARDSNVNILLNGTFTHNGRVLHALHKNLTVTLDGEYSYNTYTQGTPVLVMSQEGDENSEIYLHGKYLNNTGSDMVSISKFKKVVIDGYFEGNAGDDTHGVVRLRNYGNVTINGTFNKNNCILLYFDTAGNPDSIINISNAVFTNNEGGNDLIYTSGIVPCLLINNSVITDNNIRFIAGLADRCDNLTVTYNTVLRNNYSEADDLKIIIKPGTVKDIHHNNVLEDDEVRVRTNLKADISSTTIYRDRNASLKVTLTGLDDFTGAYVLLNITGQPTKLIQLDSNGEATEIISGLDTGIYNIVAYYPGDKLYAQSTATIPSLIVQLNEANAGTFTDLNRTIYEQAARNNGIVDLERKNYTYDPSVDSLFSGGINLNESISKITGSHAVISGDGKARIFNIVTGTSTIEIDDIVFNKGSSSSGSAIYINRKSIIKNSEFNDNQATTVAGAIYIMGAGSEITNCVFNRNKITAATNGGGAINIWGTNVVVNDCEFNNNYGANGGAIRIYRNNAQILNSRFNYNTADSGGAIYINDNTVSKTTISGSSFTGNTASSNGGAVCNVRPGLTISGSHFINNNAPTGKSIRSTNSFTVENCDFTNLPTVKTTLTVENIEDTSVMHLRYSEYADALISDYSINFNGDNKYRWNGTEDYTSIPEGTVGNPKNNILPNSPINIIIKNESGFVVKEITDITTDSNGDFTLNYTEQLVGVDFKTATATFTYAGDEYYTSSTGTGTYTPYVPPEPLLSFTDLNNIIQGNISEGIFEIKLTNNYTYNQSRDEASFKDGIEITDNDVVIDGDGHTIDGKSLARIFKITGKNVELKNINFINGQSTTGGAIYIDAEDSNTKISKSNFTDNKATGSNAGGAIGINKGSATISECNFTTNNGGTFGGAIYAGTNNNEISQCRFISNSATSGGAIFSRGSNNLMSDCTFTSNTASNNGGAIDIVANENTVSGCTFTTNHANTLNGGAIYLNGTQNIIESNNVFDRNDAKKSSGGAILVTGTGNTVSGTFTGNTAVNGGAIFITNDDSITENNVVSGNFTSNSATTFAGAVGQSGSAGTGNEVSGTFTTNTAPEGGAIGTYSLVDIHDSVFTGNTRNNGAITGAAISAIANIRDCEFIKNKMYVISDSSVAIVLMKGTSTMDNCEFTNNIILGVNPEDAVAVKVTGTATISNSKFNDPLAKLYEISNTESGVLTLTNNTITGGTDKAKIYNTGIITNMTATVLDNKTVSGKTGEVITLNASNFTDDKQNKIYNSKLTFNVLDMNDPAVSIGTAVSSSVDDDGVVYADYTIPNTKNQLVTLNGITIPVKTGVITNIGKSQANINITFTDPIGIGHDQKITIKVNGGALPIANEEITIVTNISGYNTPFICSTNDDGVIELSIPSSSLTDMGDYWVNASFEGNDDFEANSTNKTFSVSVNIPELIVNVENSIINYGDSQIFNITLTCNGNNVNGIVTLKINDTLTKEVMVTEGNGSITVSDLIPGEYTVNATYDGDTTLNYGAASGNVSFTVLDKITLIVKAQNSTIDYGEDAIITVQLTRYDGSPLTVVPVRLISGIQYTTVTTNSTGGANWTVSGLNKGDYTVEAYLDKTTLFDDVYNVTNFTVEVMTPNITVSVKDNYTTLEGVILNITTDYKGKVFYTISINGTSYRKELGYGLNNVNIGKLVAGTNYTGTVYFAATPDANAATGSVGNFSVVKVDVPINVSDVNITVGNDTIVNVTVPAGLNGQKVTITINGTIKTVTIDKNGNATAVFSNIPAGKYNITVTYDGNDDYKSNSTNATLTVNKINTDLSSQTHKNIKYKLFIFSL